MQISRAVSSVMLMVSVLVVVAGVTFVLGQGAYLAARYFVSQDLIVLFFLAIVLNLFRRMVAGGPETAPQLSRGLLPAVTLGMMLLAWAGSHLVFSNYPLSADEWWAAAEGVAYWRGWPYAPFAQTWRGFATAMTPSFVVTSAGETLWGSMYLPVNGLLQGALPAGMASAVLAGWSLCMAWCAARLIAPEKPRLAGVAVLFLFGSAQVTVTAMTPYAMTAHLAFNLTWLVLVLQRKVWAHLAAAMVGFAAVGLHQPIFFPLFAAPFVLWFWLRRDWAAAVIHTIGLGLAALFWSDWLAFGMGLMGGSLPVADKASWAVGPVTMALRMIARISLADIWIMAQNLVRFATWTHPLLFVFTVAGLVPAWRQGGVLRALVLGVALTFGLVAVVSPYQGHGWGYRYLHGLLGSFALVAAFGFVRLLDLAAEAEARRIWTGFLAVTGLCLAVLLPLRMWQAHAFVAPYAAADAAVAGVDADFVIFTDIEHAFSGDLVRNDPLLRNRPLRFALAQLTQPQLDDLCQRGRVLVFDAEDAEHFGIAARAYDPKGLPVWPQGCSTTGVTD